MNNLRVTLVQTTLFWEDTHKNLDHFDLIINRITEPTDLILLPETFNTGYSINPEKCAETPDGPSTAFLRRKAREKNVVIMATLLVCEGTGCYNRLISMHPDGHFESYDKRHLFRLSEEHKIFKGGRNKVIMEVRGWKIAPVICYDLRFPVWSKNTWSEGTYEYDMMACLANWPASRSHVWKTLLMARAIENQAYVAGVNRIGTDGNGTRHAGYSMAVDARGSVLYAAGEDEEGTKTVEFSAQELQLFRDSFTVGMDWDHFRIDIT